MTNQYITDGCLVVRKGDHVEHNCLFYTYHPDLDHDPILDVCIGLVIEAMPDESEVTVSWIRMCPYAKRMGQIYSEGVERDYLRVVGKLS